MYSYVQGRIERCESRSVAPGVKMLHSGSSRRIYYVLDNNDPIAWLFLVRRPGWQAWEVHQIWAFPEHRGKGLAQRLYSAAINADGVFLASGNLHTQYSQALWKSFIKKRLFNIWAQDFRDLSKTSEVLYDADLDELICDLPIYKNDIVRGEPRVDVRLLALRKD